MTQDLGELLGLGAQDDDTETVTCPEPDCKAGPGGAPWTYTGPRKGRNSTAWRLGLHKRNSHGEAGGSKRRAKPGAPSEAEIAARPALGIVRTMAAEVEGGKGAPTEAALTRALGRGISIVTVGASTWAVESDPNIGDGPEGAAIRDSLIDELSLSEKAAQDVMRPVGRMLAPTKLNKRYGRGVVDNVDVLASFVELAALGSAWRRYLRVRMQPAAAPGYQLAPTPGAAPAPAQMTTSPAPTAGRVVTADDVAAMQARQQRGI